MGRHRKPGRPKGSKNKPGHKAGRPRKLSSAVKRARAIDESEFRRLRGRPKGTGHKMALYNSHGTLIGHVKTK